MLNKYPNILKLEEVADILRVHKATVKKMVKRGYLERIKGLSNRYLFNKEQIINFIEKGGVNEK